jgi:Tol biopolymer transport system component
VYNGVGPAPADALTRQRGTGEIPVGGGIVLESISDGKRREVVRREGSVPQAKISPDGRYIAFAEYKAGVFQILIAPVQGGEPRLLSEESFFVNRLMEWTPDGRFLAISSQRSGAEALYLFPVKDGQRSGEPVLVRYGSFSGGTMQLNGSLTFFAPRTGGAGAMLATLDSNSLGAWKPLDLKIAGNAYAGTLQWSPDATRILYESRHDDAGQQGGTFRVRDIAAGEDREVYRSASETRCMWETRGQNLVCSEVQGSTEEFSTVALDSLRVERLGTLALSRDPGALEQFLREKHVERVLPDLTGSLGPLALVRVARWNLEFRPTRDSAWKLLAALNLRPYSEQPLYSPRGVFYFDKDSAGKDGLFRFPLEGGQPERLGDSPGNWRNRYIHVSPDGRNVLVEGVRTDVGIEAWLLENFIPKAPAR